MRRILALVRYPDQRRGIDAQRLRPRHDGYMPFQAEASARINAGLIRHEPAETVIDDINTLFRRSL